LGPGEPTPRIHLGRDAVTLAELSERLEKLRADGVSSRALVLLQTDAGTPVGVEREVTELALGKGFRLALVGKSTPATAQKPSNL
jgi:hypothetical protein